MWNDGHLTPSTDTIVAMQPQWCNGISMLINISIQTLAKLSNNSLAKKVQRLVSTIFDLLLLSLPFPFFPPYGSQWLDAC